MALIGVGGSISVNDGMASAQQAFTEVKTVTPDFGNSSVHDVTSLSSSSSHKDWIAGMIDGGTLKVDGWYSGAMQVRLLALLNTSKTYVITAGPGSTGSKIYTFPGILTKHSFQTEPDAPQTYSAEIKVTGTVVITAVS